MNVVKLFLRQGYVIENFFRKVSQGYDESDRYKNVKNKVQYALDS